MSFWNKNSSNKYLVWQSLPDEDLVNLYTQTNDLKFLGELFERYTHLLFSVSMKYLKNEEESKDAVMAVFEELVIKLKKHEVINFKNWVYTLTKNYCLMQLRKKTQLQKFQERAIFDKQKETMENVIDLHHTDEDFPLETLSNLYFALNTLNVEQSTCLKLFYLEKKSYKEVTEITGFTLNQVKSYIQNGKRNLKNYFDTINESE